MIWNFEFEQPWFLLLLLLLPVLIFWHLHQKDQHKPAMKISTLRAFGNNKSNLGTYKPILFILRLISFGLIIVAFARPRIAQSSSHIKSDKGVDIIMTVDVSLSMLAKDLKPDRLNALKEVAEKFADHRANDRIGLVAYSGEALTKVPLTTDRQILKNEINKLQTSELEDGTAIGVGLATAVNHLKNSKAKSKVIILITDGVESIDHTNDLMYIAPEQAADIAASKGIKVYTIGIGTNGMAPFPTGYDMLGNYIFDMQPVQIDEPLLKSIAQKTGGEYFRATDNQSLAKIYDEIDHLEKTDINDIKYYSYTELFQQFLFPGFLLLVLELLLAKTVFKELI